MTREYDEGIKKQQKQEEQEEIPTTPFSSKNPYFEETFKRDKDEMAPGYNDQYHNYIAEEAQKRKQERLNDTRKYVLDNENPLENIAGNQTLNESNSAYKKRMKKNQRERERYYKYKDKKKTQIIDDDEYNGGYEYNDENSDG